MFDLFFSTTSCWNCVISIIFCLFQKSYKGFPIYNGKPLFKCCCILKELSHCSLLHLPFLADTNSIFFCLTNHISRWFPIYIEKPLLFCFSSDPTEMSQHSLLCFLVPFIWTTYLSPEI